MNWLNIETTTLDSEEFVGSEPTARATWLCLLRYCVGQENGGRIADCKGWADRKWQQLARVTQAEVSIESALWKWDGDTLEIWAYPVDKESEVKAKREAGRLGGLSRSEAKLKAVRANGAKHNQSTSKPEPKQNQSGDQTERKGKERKGIGIGKEQGCADESAPDADATWLAIIKTDKAYAGIDVEREFARMKSWCEAHRKLPSRRRFVNWLLRCERPIEATGTVVKAYL
jgi:hypothetical protein